MRVIYIAGPYRAPSIRAVVLNIRAAEEWALRLWGMGAVPISPHMQSRLFDGALPDEVWLRGDLELLRRSDAIALLPGWHRSRGTEAEVRAAREWGLPVFILDYERDLAALEAWIGEGATE